ncbi:aldolase/citrate lyase family protein [Magnetovibrio blakemorei]|uniref:Aldolase n=1 Tax=Magnetovibrio blakemorei TaxID=28181 RepID=A0A1E5QCU3_9PROT|nr:aldolase/citrate lyase family protein [Magnetovibrio blakemorei]OEJ69556.1 aldolase [Magnetovibrio blakemorei]
MNKIEKEMLAILRQGKEEFGYLGVKSEFEAEGTRVDEFLRLLEITRRADLNVGLKIGGCEAIRDLYEAQQFGVDYIIAPMIETPYALRKYIEAVERTYGTEGIFETDFLFNIETITAFNNLDELTSLAGQSKVKPGVVFGRVDFSLSNDFGRAKINTDEVQDYVCTVAQKCKDQDLNLVVGGGVSNEAIPGLKKIKAIRLDRFETRKIIFNAAQLSEKNIEKSLLAAVHFEILWLQNKQDYYTAISNEDDARIKMLKSRWM